jgi:hypothetical protein
MEVIGIVSGLISISDAGVKISKTLYSLGRSLVKAKDQINNLTKELLNISSSFERKRPGNQRLRVASAKGRQNRSNCGGHKSNLVTCSLWRLCKTSHLNTARQLVVVIS